MAVLVTGGAGYIGSHMAWRLLDAGERVVVLDSLEGGHAWSVPPAARFVQGDVADGQALARALDLAGEPVDAVLHFAGSVSVPESVERPEKYYRNNTCATLALVEGCRAAGIANVIFSSTAAVYGEVGSDPVDESAPALPTSPYGTSKLMSERMLADIAGAHSLRCGVLRYFNVAGADPQGRTGHSTRGAGHLLKVACEAALGLRDGLTIHGTDYPTRDGTAERDFIHVTDLVEAHYLALQQLRAGDAGFTLNCGYGRGYTVLETIGAVKRLSGSDFPVHTGPRRPGDIASVIADNRQILARLGWAPVHDDIDTIAAHALAWERKLLQRSES
ncbi:UDP-glucose 4-epimerase GalE [Stappia indica]|uniref:UDP-glucose 4-epimerase n=1 Tax=Stappia indica TaxID=538381 RepID=A0A285RQC6_9HYPH|nr:UDP-glucose 4-epimerase GalE [Stappia indica]SOB96316.1 UDP-galactose 4-epimerase [Stappia indica]